MSVQSIEKQEIDKFSNLDLGQQNKTPKDKQLQSKPGSPQSGELASIKKAGEKEVLSLAQIKERAKELKRCKNDILYFCRKYFKIVSLKDGLVTLDPYPKQAELLKFIQDNNRSIVCASRQVGKCVSAETPISIFSSIEESVSIGELFSRASDSGNEVDVCSSGKFVQSFNVSGYKVFTDTGWKNIKSIHKTVEYVVWELTTETYGLECADNHIVFDSEFNEVFVKDLKIGQLIWTESGLEKVVDVHSTDRSENMYDIQLDDDSNHRYYTNGILSHNTTIYTVYLLWYAMYHPDKRIMVCGNKLDIAIEIMDRIRLGYEYCPSDIKIGVTTYNKKCIEFENNSIIRCFATGSSGCRGFSANCVSKYTWVKVRLFGWLKLKLPMFMLRWFGHEREVEHIEEGLLEQQGLVDGDNREMSIQLRQDASDEQVIFYID